MTDNLFDNFIKDKMQNASTPVREEVWQNIIAREKKRRGIFWWQTANLLWVGLGLLLIGGIGFFALNTSNSKKIVTVKANETQASANVEVVEKSNKAIEDKKEEKEELIHNKSTLRQVQKSYSKDVKANSSQSKKMEFLYVVTPKTKLNSSYKQQNFTTTNRDYKLKSLQTSTPTKFSLSNNVDGYIHYSDYNFSSINFKAGNTVSLDKSLMLSNATPSQFPIINMRKLLGLNGEECGTYAPKDLFIEAYGSADYSTKHVTNISTTDNYLRRKDSAEKQQIGFSAGVRLSKNLTDNWFLKAGIQYSQINELFTTRFENERRQTIVINTRTLIRMGLPDTTISDTSILLQIGYKTERTQNRYTSLEIPLLLSYETGNAESNWKLAITGGLIINATTWYSGKTYDDNFNVVSLKSANNGTSFYRHQLGFSIYSSASIIRKLTPTLSLFAEPYYRIGINKNNISAGFTQQFNTMGANVGLRIKLNK